ncbi:MAG: hypothetical protein GXY08_13585, partial [Ruminococcus sp.]|nr:hypothetical protein [Ruminococcus sp.]
DVYAFDEDYEVSPGHIFRFKDNGTLLWGFDKKDGILRYFDYSDGMLQKDKEFYVLDGKTYYFKEKGILACNEKCDINVNGTEYTYWFGDNGAMITGWHSDGKNYYLLASNGRMFKNSYIELGGAYYHLDGNGIMAADTDVEWKNGIKLHANSEGALDLSVLNQYQLNEFKNEVAAY